jgi:hypothetical protein
MNKLKKERLGTELILLVIFRMSNRQLRSGKDKLAKKDHHTTLSVLNLPSKSLLLPLASPLPEYRLFHHSRSKISIAVFTIAIPRVKLFNNL